MVSYSELPEAVKAAFARYVIEQGSKADTFSVINGVSMVSGSEKEMVGELTVSEGSLNTWGIVHGGCLVTLADTTAGTLVVLNGYNCVTLSCNVNFLRPARGSVIRCTARPEKVGRSTSVINVSLTDEQGKEVASGTYTFFHTGAVNEESLRKAGVQ